MAQIVSFDKLASGFAARTRPFLDMSDCRICIQAETMVKIQSVLSTYGKGRPQAQAADVAAAAVTAIAGADRNRRGREWGFVWLLTRRRQRSVERGRGQSRAVLVRGNGGR